MSHRTPYLRTKLWTKSVISLKTFILQIWVTWASKITIKNFQLCIIKIKGSHAPVTSMKPLYMQKEPKNENLVSVQKAYGTVWVGKLLGFTQRRIRTKLEICVNSCLLITMVCCLHQSNSHIKRKLWAWRAQKYRHWVGSKSAQTCTGLSNFGPIRICKLRCSLQARSGLCAFFTDSVFVFIGFPCPKQWKFA